MFETSLSAPVSWLALAGFLIGMLLAVITVKRVGWQKEVLVSLGVIILLPCLLLLLALNQWIWDPRFRAYSGFYQDIEVGMTKADVMRLLENHYPAGGERGHPIRLSDGEDSEGMGFFLNCEGRPGPNCEGIFFAFKEGRIIEKKYSPD